MKLIPWRKLRAGQAGQYSDSVSAHTQQTTIDEMSEKPWDANRIHARNRLRIPVGADKYTTASNTVTFYPNADPEVSSVDGFVFHLYPTTKDTWANLIAAGGTEANDSESGSTSLVEFAAVGLHQWYYLTRSIFLFDTSSLPDDAVISSAVFSVCGTSKSDELGVTPDLNIYSANPASNTALVAGDYDSFGITPYCDTPITYATYTESGWNNFTLNTAGKAAISKTGITKIGVRNANYDVAATEPANSDLAKSSYFGCYYADAGKPYRPELTITYTSLTSSGYVWVENDYLHYINENGTETTILIPADVDDTPVDGATTDPVSSNWAYDHVAAADPHIGYVLKSLFDAYSILYADTDNTPAALSIAASRLIGRKSTGGIAALTGAEVLAVLSGQSGAAFDWHAQDLSNIKVLYVTDANLYLYVSGINAILNFDAYDYLNYDRTGNTLKLIIGGVEVANLAVDNTAGGTDGATTQPASSNIVYDHGVATTGVHGVGAGTIAKTSDITATKLDDFATPDDNTDLNASTSRHGLLLKLDNVATNFLNGQGAWAVPAGAGGANLIFTLALAQGG